jgi:isopentenyl-diphosphate delta-isomerase
VASVTEFVVLVSEEGQAIGSADKATVHTTDTPLHLAFSCHVFNEAGEVLVTRRALAKKTWPGVWTNSFCGHPAPEEALEDALQRRARQELGFVVTDVRSALPDFRYRAVDASGVVEYEICPVFVARTINEPLPEPDEVCEFAWVEPHALLAAVEATPWAFSPWITLQLPALRDAGFLLSATR